MCLKFLLIIPNVRSLLYALLANLFSEYVHQNLITSAKLFCRKFVKFPPTLASSSKRLRPCRRGTLSINSDNFESELLYKLIVHEKPTKINVITISGETKSYEQCIHEHDAAFCFTAYKCDRQTDRQTDTKRQTGRQMDRRVCHRTYALNR